MTTPAPLLSPLLVDLQHELEIGNPATRDAFWQNVTERRRTPLTETIKGDGSKNHPFLIKFAKGSLTWRQPSQP